LQRLFCQSNNQGLFMQENEQTQSVLERRIDVVVPIEAIEQEVESRIKKLAKTVKMAGFRPGKVPYKIVAQTYGPQARSEAIGAAVEKTFNAKVQEQNLRVAGYPRIEPKDVATAGALEFSAVFEVYPEFQLGDVSGEPVEQPDLVVTDEHVNKTIEVLRKQRTSYEAVDRAAAEGDRVVVDFVGRKDGEEFDGGRGSDFPFVLGAGSMLKDFESATAGLAPGESKLFDVNFPEDYHAKNLAGQTAQFELTLKKVEAPSLPEVDGDFARVLGVADGDVAKMRDEVRKNLEREVKRRLQGRLKEQVMNLLLKVNPIEVPKALVQREAEQLAENAKRDLEMRGMKTKEIPVEPGWFLEQAERRVKLGLIMAELVKSQNLQSQAAQIRTLVEDFAQSYEDPAEVIDWYYSQPQRLAQAEALVIEDNVVAWVLANAQTVSQAVSFDELMSNAA
jgi:trigger factor